MEVCDANNYKFLNEGGQIGIAPVALLALETRKASFPATLFQSAKESVKGEVQSFQHVALDTAQTLAEFGYFSTGVCQLFGLLVKIERFAFTGERESLPKMANPVFKTAIQQEAALIQSLFARFHERLVRAQLELESLAHRVSIRFSHCRLLLENNGLWLGLGRDLHLSLSCLYFTLTLLLSKTTAC